MAIALVDDTIHVATGSDDAPTITLPSSATSGRVALIWLGARGGSNAEVDSIPSGWTERGKNNNGTSTHGAFYRRVLGSGETGNSVVFSLEASARWRIALLILSGVDTTTPDDAGSVAGTGFAASYNTPDRTPAVANAYIVAAFAGNQNRTVTPPTDFTEKDDGTFQTSNNYIHTAIAVYQASNAASGTVTIGSFSVGGGSTSGLAGSIALYPAAEATPVEYGDTSPTATDAIDGYQITPAGDTGSGAEGPSPLTPTAGLELADARSATDQLELVVTGLEVSDPASTADQSSLVVLLEPGDIAQADEAIASLTAAIDLGDPRSAQDALDQLLVSLEVAQAAIGQDTQDLLVSLEWADPGAGADGSTVSTPEQNDIVAGDSVTAVDLLTDLVVALDISEPGSAGDQMVLAAIWEQNDSGVVQDTLDVTTALLLAQGVVSSDGLLADAEVSLGDARTAGEGILITTQQGIVGIVTMLPRRRLVIRRQTAGSGQSLVRLAGARDQARRWHRQEDIP